MARPLRLRARWVVPIASDPFPNGEVVVEDGRIAEVRAVPEGAPAGDSREFGEAAILPGLVNAHTHLDYTLMRGLIEDIPFFDWIRELTERKAALDEQDWIASATIGAAEAVAGGVTTLADCTDSGAALLGALAAGLRGTVYQEVFSMDESQPVDELVRDLDIKVRALRWRASGSRIRIGISPHAPYTVRPAAIRALCDYARKESMPVCIHAAESQAEADLLRNGRGVIAQRFVRRGIGWLLPPPGSSTVAYLDSLGALGPQTLLVHGVQLSAGDRDIVRRTGAAWAHCPKSNAKLGNGIAPIGLMKGGASAGEGRIGLGSDSVASNNSMDMLEEMRFAVLAQRAQRRNWQALTAREAVEMATIGGARALGLEQEIGTLEPGKAADIAVVRLDGLHCAPCYNPYNALVFAGSARDVALTMIGGEAAYDGGEPRVEGLAAARARFCDAARRMAAWRPAA